MKELAVLAAIYGLVITSEWCHHRYSLWRKLREARRTSEAELSALDAISPLFQSTPERRSLWARCKRHAVAAAAAAVIHPATGETFKHYAVHFIVYSGYVIKH